MIFSNRFLPWMFLVCLLNPLAVFSTDLQKVEEEIIEELEKGFSEDFEKIPFLLLVGGYPGAGKTSLIQALAEKYKMAVISYDKIRQALLTRHLKGSAQEPELIQKISQALLFQCLERKISIAIDSNAHAKALESFQALLNAHEHGCLYRILPICLDPPIETLVQRLKARKIQEGIHQGTEAHLLRDIQLPYKTIYKHQYALVIENGENMSFEEELEMASAFLDLWLKTINP